MFTSRGSAIKARPCTFCRTDLRVTLCGKVKVWEDRSRSESESEEGDKLHDVAVEKGGDELWIAEKFQSNPEIAGSPRNSFRASLKIDYWG